MSAAKSLRVALIDPLGQHAGNHQYTDQLARGLTNAGAIVTVYTHVGDIDRSPDRPYEYLESFYGIYGEQHTAARAMRFLRCLAITYGGIIRTRADVIHVQMWTHDVREVLQIALAKLLRKKLIVSVHEVKGWSSRRSASAMSEPNSDHDCRKATRQFKWVISHADAVVVHNRFSLDLLTSLYNANCPTAIIPLPHVAHVRSTASLPDRATARARLGLPNDRTIFLFFGNCRLDKRLDLALSALAELRESKTDIMLVTAGKMKPAEEAAFQGIARKLQLGEMLRMDVGLVPDDLAADYFRSANAVVIPYHEVAESGVAITASTYQRAIIASDLTPLLEATDSGRLGLHFRSGDAHALAYSMQLAASMAEKLDAMGALARERTLRERDPDAIGVRMLALYRQAIED